MQTSGRRRIRYSSPPRAGLTLLELVAATLLAVMLCVAVLGMTASSARRHREIVAQLPARPWLPPLSEQLRWDILQARSFRVRADSLELHGFGSRDFGTAVAYHGPAVVIYQIVKDGDMHWLLRKEMHVDDLSHRYFRSEFVCTDVGGLRLAALSGQQEAAQHRGGPLDDLLGPAEAQQLPAEGPLPERVVVSVLGLKEKTTIVREVICRR